MFFPNIVGTFNQYFHLLSFCSFERLDEEEEVDEIRNSKNIDQGLTKYMLVIHELWS